MTTERDAISVRNTVNYYKHAFEFNQKIIDLLHEFGKSDDDEKHVILDNITVYLKELSRFTSKISLTILERTYPKEIADQAAEKIEDFRRTMIYTEKFLIGKKFLDSSIYNIELLVEKSQFDKYDYFRYAKDEKDLAHKIGLILADPKRVMEYKAVLSKISNGKMEVDEFKKLFDSIKGKLPTVQNEEFVSFANFKKSLNHDI